MTAESSVSSQPINASVSSQPANASVSAAKATNSGAPDAGAIVAVANADASMKEAGLPLVNSDSVVSDAHDPEIGYANLAFNNDAISGPAVSETC